MSRPSPQTRLSEIGKSARALSTAVLMTVLSKVRESRRGIPQNSHCSALTLYPLNALMQELLLPKAWGADLTKGLPGQQQGQFQSCRSPLALTTVS